jgi:DNA-binding MarR family transcriptional regulator
MSQYDIKCRSTATGQAALRQDALDKPHYEALAAFRRALRRFTAFSADAARAAGLTPQQHQALLAIRGAPGRDSLSVGEIADHLLIRPNSAAELVERMAALDLVTRSPDPADSRRVAVGLTPHAIRLLQELSASHWAELQTIGPTLQDLLARFGVTPDPDPS